MAGDSNFANVVLALGMQGANSSTSIPDSSTLIQHAYAKGGVNIQSNRASFDGAGDYILVECDQNLMFGSSDSFTIETILDTTQTTVYATILSNTDASFGAGFFTWVFNNGSNNGFMALYVGNYSGVSPLVAQSASALNDGNDHHIALTKNGTTWDLWADGASVASATWSGALNNNFRRSLNIGIDLMYGRDFSGTLGPFRISNYARYTGSFTPPTASTLYWYAGQITGNITESLAITKWRITATKCSDGTFAGSTTTTGSTYTINCNTLEACNVTLAPHVDRKWTTGYTPATGELWVPSNPDTTPHLFECTTSGAVGGTEPTWNTTPSATTSDGSAVWTCVGPLPTPKALGPRIPS